ncbi:MAG: asparaginase [Leptolyngbya sp. PLA3]|nr:MAG: asparaginase [Cyanobacteria bacterium CYA]MCE7968625.1 asparaginase [Leptolyngbya sp. PL-A3]
MRHIHLVSTGGTIEKTYDERQGALSNVRSVVPLMLRRLRLEDTRITTLALLSKDSLDLTDQDRCRILDTVARLSSSDDCDGVVILHGTDTLCVTGELLHARLHAPPCPIVLTGAMRPYEMKRSDALQNLTEAIFATAMLPPGVYVAAHGRALHFPGVVKDHTRSTFVRREDARA